MKHIAYDHPETATIAFVLGLILTLASGAADTLGFVTGVLPSAFEVRTVGALVLTVVVFYVSLVVPSHMFTWVCIGVQNKG